MKTISADKQRLIAHELRNGTRTRAIADKVGVSIGVVSKYRKLLAPDAQRASSGRPTKISKAKMRLIKRLVLSGQLTTIVAVHKFLTTDGLNVSYDTTSRMLKSMNFLSKTKKK